jgi:hypothetical protein
MSLASDEPWPSAAAGRREPAITVQAKSGSKKRRRRRIRGFLKEVVLLVLVVLLFPLVILLMGAPIALFVRLLLEIAQRA